MTNIYCTYCKTPTHADTSCPYQLKEETMSKNVYFVLTEEGMESMASSPLKALTNYLATGSFGDENEWLNSVINGESEINSIVEMTQAEYKKWLKTAIET